MKPEVRKHFSRSVQGINVEAVQKAIEKIKMAQKATERKQNDWGKKWKKKMKKNTKVKRGNIS